MADNVESITEALTTRDVAKILEVNLPRVQELIRQNVLPHFRLGRQIPIDREIGRQLAVAGGPAIVKKALPPWRPNLKMLDQVKQYFLGFRHNDRQIFPKREEITKRLRAGGRLQARRNWRNSPAFQIDWNRGVRHDRVFRIDCKR